MTLFASSVEMKVFSCFHISHMTHLQLHTGSSAKMAVFLFPAKNLRMREALVPKRGLYCFKSESNKSRRRLSSARMRLAQQELIEDIVLPSGELESDLFQMANELESQVFVQLDACFVAPGNARYY